MKSDILQRYMILRQELLDEKQRITARLQELGAVLDDVERALAEHQDRPHSAQFHPLKQRRPPREHRTI